MSSLLDVNWLFCSDIAIAGFLNLGIPFLGKWLCVTARRRFCTYLATLNQFLNTHDWVLVWWRYEEADWLVDAVQL